MKLPHWHQILVIFMIYALLSRNFDVRIYALFPQIFENWKVDSADFFTFRMYALDAVLILLGLKSWQADSGVELQQLLLIPLHSTQKYLGIF